jgi:hypothetical protein
MLYGRCFHARLNISAISATELSAAYRNGFTAATRAFHKLNPFFSQE